MSQWVMLYLLTFVGSSLGGLVRFLVCRRIAGSIGERFPVGTMMVNATGAFLIGVVWGLPWEVSAGGSNHMRDFLTFGFLGGYTTVSTFSLQTLELFREGEWTSATLNLFGSFLLCLGAVFAGYASVGTW